MPMYLGGVTGIAGVVLFMLGGIATVIGGIRKVTYQNDNSFELREIGVQEMQEKVFSYVIQPNAVANNYFVEGKGAVLVSTVR